MAEAIARAAIDRNIVAPSKMIAADPAGPRQQVFGQLGVTICQGNAEVIAQSSHVLLAIKPQTLVAIRTSPPAALASPPRKSGPPAQKASAAANSTINEAISNECDLSSTAAIVPAFARSAEIARVAALREVS